MKKLLNALALFIGIGLIVVGCISQNQDKDTPPISSNIHLKYGNPSDANLKDTNNYLLEKPQYALSYNCKTGTANWVSWQLNRSWLGNVERSDDFRPDPELPDNCYAVRPTDYRGSGYDRGHLAPSGDRTRKQSDNSARHLSSNCTDNYAKAESLVL
ncbi:MAG: DNA/RNA non-specific endonuclease [Xenococcus sp. (in: cyanobacteria)]